MTRNITIFLLIMVALMAAPFAHAALDDNLLLLTPEFIPIGDEPWGGGYWEDTSGNGHHVFNVNAASFDGSALTYGTNRSTSIDAGVTTFASLGEPLELIFANGSDSDFNPGLEDYSLAFWYYQTDNSYDQHIFTMGSSGSTNPAYAVIIDDTTGPLVRFADASGTGVKGALKSNYGSIEGWHHVAVTFDRTGAQSAAGTVSIYVDSYLTNSTVLDPTYDLTAASGTEILLGGRWANTATGYIGYVDDLAVYKGTISATDVATLYSAPRIETNTITTPGVSPVMIHNFENNLTDGFVGGLVPSLDATGRYEATPSGNMLSIIDDPQRGEVVQFPGVEGNNISFGDPGENADDLDIGTGDYTVSIWFNPSSSAEAQFLLDKGNVWSYNAGLGVIFDSMKDGRLQIRATTTEGVIHNLTTYCSLDEWHHLAIVIDNDDTNNGLFSAYLDGQSSEAIEGNIWTPKNDGVTLAPGADFSNDDPLLIGERNDSVLPFRGLADDFAVWHRALTEAEILDIYTGAAILPEKVPGDANSDGQVDGSDVTILAGNWQVGVDPNDPTEVTWAMGDFNGDGQVDGSDVTILAGNWQHGVTAAASAVPEPSTIVLLLAGIAGLFVIRRR